MTKPMANDINLMAKPKGIDINLMAMIFTNDGFGIRMTPSLSRGILLRCLLLSYFENIINEEKSNMKARLWSLIRTMDLCSGNVKRNDKRDQLTDKELVQCTNGR